MSSLFKMKDLVDTRFLYITIGKDIQYILEKCRDIAADRSLKVHAGNAAQETLYKAVSDGEVPIFDLCDCKLTSDVAQTIFVWQNQGVQFVDSTDSKRNAILIENTRRIRECPKEIIKMPEYKLNITVKEYMGKLSEDVVYTYYAPQELYYALVILITMVNPKIQFEMDNVMAAALDSVSTLLSTTLLEQYDEFYYHTNNGVEILKAVNGKVTTQRLGNVDIPTARSDGALVPTAFGKEVLFRQPGWEEAFKMVLAYVNREKELRPKTLREVLVGDNYDS